MTGPGKILSEIRRRHVFRVVGLYIVAAWGVLQVCDLAFQSWELPDDALRHVWMALFVLFPLVVFIGWRTIWQFDTMLNRNHDSLRDTDAYTAILEDVRADLRAQATELS